MGIWSTGFRVEESGTDGEFWSAESAEGGGCVASQSDTGAEYELSVADDVREY